MVGKIDTHCCEEMRRHIEMACDQHPNQFDCPDCLIHFSSSRGIYGLIVHDGGTSFIRIAFCPFCGAKLPDEN